MRQLPPKPTRTQPPLPSYHSQAARDLAQALLSLDEETIKLCARRWGLTLPLDEHTFWLVVHKVRSGLPTLPPEVRLASTRWLTARGYHPLELYPS